MSNLKNLSYIWKMNAEYPLENNGYSVFSCFSGGGGSTMGYKLAGFDVIGCNEIDEKALQCYIKNHNSKFIYDEPIQELKEKPNLPNKLFKLDILDGSPPCTAFSFAGNRQKDWGKKKKYSEGNYKQVIDTLFFDFIDFAERLQPKIIITENVYSLLLGKSQRYVQKIYSELKDAGYFTIHYVIDSSTMGVPQKRNRIFFFSVRKDLINFIPTKGFFNLPKLNLNFKEKSIKFKDIYKNVEVTNKEELQLTELYQKYWKQAKQGEQVGKFDTCKKMAMNLVPYTQTTGHQFHPIEMRKINHEEYRVMATFPEDYDFCDLSSRNIQYITAMSVPPIMMAKISDQIKKQWLNNIFELHKKGDQK